jgi:hypothetical protein
MPQQFKKKKMKKRGISSLLPPGDGSSVDEQNNEAGMTDARWERKNNTAVMKPKPVLDYNNSVTAVDK